MRRPLLLLAAGLVAQTAFAFNPTLPRRNRITVLQAAAYEATDVEVQIARGVRERLLNELRGRGFDAVDGTMTYDDVQRSGAAVSGLYVELAPAGAESRTRDDVEVNTRNVGIDVAMLVSRVAAELRVYDGRTLELVSKKHLSHEDVRVVPAGIGAKIAGTGVR